jgi:lipopolysaccharide export system permease protein
MKLFFYVLADYVKYVLGTLVLSLFIFILMDFVQKTTKYMAEYSPKGEDLALFYVYQSPGLIVQVLPIASLLGSVVSMVVLSRSNEVTAMRAVGMSPVQIAAPLAVGGLLLSLFSAVLGEWVVPVSARKMHFVEEVQIKGQPAAGSIEGAHWVRGGGDLVTFREFDVRETKLLGIKKILISPVFQPIEVMRADEAVYLGEGDHWKLKNVSITRYSSSGTVVASEHVESSDQSLHIEPAKLQKERRLPNEMSFGELLDAIERGDRAGANVLPFKVDFNIKLAYPWAAFVVSLLGLKFGFRSERKVETIRGVLLALMVGLSYWFVLSAARALGLQGNLSPWVAAWTANVTMLCIVGYQLFRENSA